MQLYNCEEKTMQIKLNEPGRSMVEMLGVLAIIGVLSVAGVMGYRFAMDKYNANITIQDISLRASDLLAQAERTSVINLDEWGTHSTMGYEWGDYGENSYQEGVFDMALLGVPKRICQQLFMGVVQATQINVNMVKANSSDLCTQTNDMVFYFGKKPELDCNGPFCFQPDDDIMREYACQTDTDCGECWVCRNSGTCTVAPNGTPCSDNGSCYVGACSYDSCQTNDDCARDEFCATKSDVLIGACIPPENFVCKRVDFIKKTISVNGKKQTWYISKKSMSYLDAENACSKMGLELPDLTEFISDWDGGFNQYPLTPLAETLANELNYTNLVWTKTNCQMGMCLVSLGNANTEHPVGDVTYTCKTGTHGMSYYHAVCRTKK